MRLRHVPVPALALVLVAGAAPAHGQTFTAVVSGAVTSATTGQPLAGVCVELYGESFASAVTGPDGTYRVEGVQPGEHLVAFNACAEPLDGFASEFYRDAVSSEQAETLRLRAGTTRTGVDASLDPAAVVRGRVTDDVTSQPLAGICVFAFDGERGFFGQGRTAADGSYAIATLRGGSYEVVFQDCNAPYLYVGEVYDDVPLDFGFGSGQRPQPVALQDGQTREGVDAALTQGGAVRGSLVGLHHGQPLPGVCVALLREGDSQDQPVSVTSSGFEPVPQGEPTDEPTGDYVFGGVRPGSYDVVVNPADFCGDSGYLPVAPTEAVQVTKGAVAEIGEVVLAPQPSIGVACGQGGPEPQPAPTFGDVRNVHAAAIECMAAYGVVTGRSDGTYGPDLPVRRDQMASFVARTLTAAGVTLPTDAPDAFTDDAGNVHESAINQLAALGVLTGKSGGTYDPGAMVTRAQTATLLVNAYQEATGFTLRSAGDAFRDDRGDVHESNIDKAATAGLAAGDGGLFRPGIEVRRDQMATFAARLLDRMQRDLLTGRLGPPAEPAAMSLR